MRVLIPLLCLCTTTVLAGKMVAFDAASPAASPAASLLAPTSAATPFATEAAKHWTELVRKQSLGLEAFAAKQMPASDPAKPAAFNLAAEVAHWKKSGNPDVLAFLNDEGKIIYGLISGDAPIAIPEVKSDSIKFHFFNKFDEKDTQGMLVEDINTLKKADWEAAQPVKVIVHGFGQSIRSPAIQTIKNAFLKTGKFNVIAVDWSKLAAAPDYRWARSNVATAGNLLGHFLKQLTEKGMVDPKQVHIIGHGLGAHVAGIAGKFMHAEPVARITGLDPAAPLFELTATDGLIQKTDAALVDIIHSNAGLLGRSDALGHADFFPNGGVMQAGCGRDFFGTCSHNRAVELFARSVLNGKGFPAVLCPHLPAIDARSCLSRDAASAEATAFMGAIASFPKPGFYFVETAEF